MKTDLLQQFINIFDRETSGMNRRTFGNSTTLLRWSWPFASAIDLSCGIGATSMAMAMTSGKGVGTCTVACNTDRALDGAIEQIETVKGVDYDYCNVAHPCQIRTNCHPRTTT
jgi:hypothetical protein